MWTRQYSFRVTKDIGKKFFLGVSAENAETLNPAGSNFPYQLHLRTRRATPAALQLASNYTSNLAPDFVIKMAFEPGWGHWEVFNIDRFFRDRIYPTARAARITTR